MRVKAWCHMHLRPLTAEDVGTMPTLMPEAGGVWTVDGVWCPSMDVDDDDYADCSDSWTIEQVPDAPSAEEPEPVVAPETGEALTHIGSTAVDPSVKALTERLMGGRS